MPLIPDEARSDGGDLPLTDTGALAKIKPLTTRRVLVPRGGPWGDAVAASLRSLGASPVVAAMINFAPADDAAALADALTALAAGEFDWLSVTSATTVDVLTAWKAEVPRSTKIAAVGETTAAALTAAGYPVDLVPAVHNTAHGLLDEWESATGGAVPLKILTLRSEVAKPLITEGLRRIGHDVSSVVAYRTVGVPVPQKVLDDVTSGAINVILVTSGSVAAQVSEQFGSIPDGTLVAAIGPRTAKDAKAAGLRIDLVAPENTVSSLIDAVVDAVGSRL